MQEALYDTIIGETLEESINGGIINHIVGTPGLGKSWSFIAIKLLHDKRIPYLLKKGSHKDSDFKVNYKLFYIYSTTNRKELV